MRNSTCTTCKHVRQWLAGAGIILLVVAIFLGGQVLWFHLNGHPVEEKRLIVSISQNEKGLGGASNSEQLEELTNLLREIEERSNARHETSPNEVSSRYLTVSNLNAFYSSLFAAVGVLVAIAGILGWRTTKEMKDKLQKISEWEEKVDRLHTRKDHVDWIKQKLNDDDSGGCFNLELQEKTDKKKQEDICSHFANELEEDIYWEMFVAKTLVDQAEFEDDPRLRQAHTRYDFISTRGFVEQHDGKAILYHLFAQLHWKKYRLHKEGKKEATEIPSFAGTLIGVTSYLEICQELYENSLHIREKHNIPLSETCGNLAVVIIELATRKDCNRQDEYCQEAIRNLRRIPSRHLTFSHHYDWARAAYLVEKEEAGARMHLKTAVRHIKSVDQRNRLLEFLDEEDILCSMTDWKKLREDLEKQLRETKFSR